MVFGHQGKDAGPANMCAAYLLATPLYFLLSLLPASITVAVVGLLPALSLWVYFSFGRNTDDLPSMAKRTDAEAAEALFPARCAAADGEGANSPAPEASPSRASPLQRHWRVWFSP